MSKKHFGPNYNPWEQRLCVVPDGDLFQTISEGKADVVTDTIERFTEQGIRTSSGQVIEADAVVVATGLKISLLGGAKISLDGEQVDMNDLMIYKGMLVSDVPNFSYAFGYTNASWTLKVDLTANYTCKLLNYMDRKGYDVVVPVKQPASSEEPFLNLSSGYIKRAEHILPKQGARKPWRVYQSYLADMLNIRHGKLVDDVLKFEKKTT